MAVDTSNLPAIPDGFQLKDTSSSASTGASSLPPIPDGFELKGGAISGQDIAQHPFKAIASTIMNPAAQNLTGKSLTQQATEKSLAGGDVPAATSRPFDANLGDVQDTAFKNNVIAQGEDAATTPATYLGGKLVEGGVNIVKGVAEAIPGVKNGIAKMLLNNEYKPTQADWDYNHDARRVMASDPGLVGDNHIETKALIDNRIKETGQNIGDTIKNSPVSNQPIGLTEDDIVGHIDDKIAELNKADPDGNAATINKLMQKRVSLTNQFDSKGNIIGPQDFSSMTPQQAFDYKLQKLGDIKYTGSDATDTTAVNSALQQSRANIVTKMNNALPELKPLNQDYGDLKSASELADKAAKKADGATLGSFQWNKLIDTPINKWILNPTNRMKMAQFLYTAPKEDIAAMSKIIPNFQQGINQAFGGQKPLGLPAPSPTLPKYLQDRQEIPPMRNPQGESNNIPEDGSVIPMKGATLKTTTNQTNPNSNVGPYQSVSPNAMDSLIKAHREVEQGNIQQQDVQNAIDMGNHFNQNNISQTGMNVRKFPDLDSLQEFIGNNGNKVKLVSTDDKGNFYAHLGAAGTTLGTAGLVVGAGNKDANASMPSDDDAIKTILGEVGPYGKQAMQYTASTIRNRNNGIQGYTGKDNPNVVNNKYTPQQYADAVDAWNSSKKNKYIDSNYQWSDADLKKQSIQDIIKNENLSLIKKSGGISFYGSDD